MRRGFMDLAVNSIISVFPGRTALWVAQEALSHDPDLSDAKNPDKSLANTLSKQVQTGRERRIWRKRIGGLYCYFPVSGVLGTDGSDNGEDIAVSLSLSAQELKDIDNLINVDKFGNRSKAIKWLVTEGVKANRAYLDKVADARNQIDRLKAAI